MHRSRRPKCPPTCAAAIAANPAAQAMFDVLTKANRFALIYRLNAVKRAETRERKIAEFVAMLARHETIHPQTAKPADSPPAASRSAALARDEGRAGWWFRCIGTAIGWRRGSTRR